jgi:hypothetical protein
MRYIAKPGTWFEEDTECQLVTDCGSMGGIFSGTRIVQEDYEVALGYELGDKRIDEELCDWDEFEVIDE